MSSNALHIGARSIIILSYQILILNMLSASMLLLALSFLYHFYYAIWDIVILGIFT